MDRKDGRIYSFDRNRARDQVESATSNGLKPRMNKYVANHTGGDVLDICNDQLGEWRQIESDCKNSRFEVSLLTSLRFS